MFAFFRVDGKEVLHLPQRRLSFDCKTSKFSQQGDILGVERVSGWGGLEAVRSLIDWLDAVSHGSLPFYACDRGPVASARSPQRRTCLSRSTLSALQVQTRTKNTHISTAGSGLIVA